MPVFRVTLIDYICNFAVPKQTFDQFMINIIKYNADNNLTGSPKLVFTI